MQLFNVLNEKGMVMKMGITLSPMYRMPLGYRVEPYEPSAEVVAEKAREESRRQIVMLEAQQARPLREAVLGDAASKVQLAAIDAQITELRNSLNLIR